MQADEHRVELPPVEALQQVARRSDPDLDQKLRVLRAHARNEGGELRPGHMVADADGEALARPDEPGQRAILRLQELAGVVEESGAARRQLHAAGRPLEEAAAEPRFEPLQLQADRAFVAPTASAARVKLSSSAMRMKASTASRSRG